MLQWIMTVAVLTALVTNADCVAAQQSTTAEAASQVTSLGFSYGGGGGVDVASDGSIRSLEFPVVRRVHPGSNAQRAGLMAGDTIVAVNGRNAKVRPLFDNRRPGTRIVMRIRRNGEEREVSFVLADDGAVDKR